MSKPDQDIDINIPPELLKELLTESEIRMIKQRLLILNLIKEGLSVREIAKKVRVGTDTVVRMSKKFRSSPNLRKISRKEFDNKSSSKWVFGQVSGEEEQ